MNISWKQVVIIAIGSAILAYMVYVKTNESTMAAVMTLFGGFALGIMNTPFQDMRRRTDPQPPKDPS